MTWLVLVPPHWMHSKVAEFPVVPFACTIRPLKCDKCYMARCDYGMVNAASDDKPKDPNGAA